MPTVTVGNVQIQPILDTNLLMSPVHFIPAYADQFNAEFGHEADERGLYRMSITTYLIRSAGKNILVDTGLGRRRRPGYPRGKLDESLREAGVHPADIDIVVHTHLHVDHVGWNTVEEESGVVHFFFPNAQHYIQQPEWDYWMTPEHLEANVYLVECVQPLAGSDRLMLRPADGVIDEHLVFVSTPGHTPGHAAIGIASAGERAIIVGDASHHPAQLNHPDWSPGFDADPVLSAKTRKRLFEDAAADGRLWMAGHWEHPGVGHILRVNGRRYFQSAALQG